MWVVIEDAKDYEINEDGAIRRISDGFRPKASVNKSLGYVQVNLRVDGRRKVFYIHRLLAKAFIPNPNNLIFVNHKDSNRSNNSLDNLEWCTPSGNTQHAYNNGQFKIVTGEKHWRAKLSDEDVEYIIKNCKKNGGQYTQSELSRMFNVTRQQISYIVLNQSRKR